jgi:hypothetical protein
MNGLLRYVALPLLTAAVLLSGLYWAADGRLDRHFHGSIADRSPQASIHVVVLDSGFHLRQSIDTSDMAHIKPRFRRAPLCTWLRMEYPRDARGWTTNGTIELRLSTPEKSWTTRFTSQDITTYFQPFCFEGSRAEDVFDRPTQLEMTVVEPDLTKVAMIALGPGNGLNNAEINGTSSQYTATYILTADPGPDREDIARFALIGLFSLALLLCVLIPLTGLATPRTRTPQQQPHTEGNIP